MSAPAPLRDALARLAEGQDLPAELASAAMEAVMSGQATPAQIGAFLMGLRVKGETVAEIVALARTMRAHSVRVSLRVTPLIDLCGTGGAALKTFNVSTVAAFIVAAAGVPVAKHGNRSHTSPSGSADVLEALGAELALPPERVSRCIERVGIGFLFAPAHHPAMRHAIGPRKEMGIRTVFNLLGPLTNPADATHHLLGVFSPQLVELYPYVLRDLGVERALVAHGTDGLDEISTVGETLLGELDRGRVRHFRLRPEALGLKRAKPQEVASLPPAESARWAREILAGEALTSPRGQIVLLNAGAALYVAERAPSLEAGLELAEETVRSGAAHQKLAAFLACAGSRPASSEAR